MTIRTVWCQTFWPFNSHHLKLTPDWKNTNPFHTFKSSPNSQAPAILLVEPWGLVLFIITEEKHTEPERRAEWANDSHWLKHKASHLSALPKTLQLWETILVLSACFRHSLCASPTHRHVLTLLNISRRSFTAPDGSERRNSKEDMEIKPSRSVICQILRHIGKYRVGFKRLTSVIKHEAKSG